MKSVHGQLILDISMLVDENGQGDELSRAREILNDHNLILNYLRLQTHNGNYTDVNVHNFEISWHESVEE